MVSLKLVHNVHVIDPLSVAIDSSNIRVFLALLSDLPFQQAVVYRVLHPDAASSSRKVEGRYEGRMGKSSGEAHQASQRGELPQ